MSTLSYQKNKAFYQSLIAIAVPIAIQNFVSSSLNLVDNVMIGQLGATAISSVALANQFFFFLNLILFGANSGMSIFISQYWGKKEIKQIHKVTSIALMIGVFIATVFFIVSQAMPETIMRLLTPDEAVIALGASYLKIVGWSYILMAISFSFSFSLRSTAQTKIPMVSSILSLGVNTLLNYLLIFGNHGFPMLGVEGAAIATLIARACEVSLILFMVYGKRNIIAIGLKDVKALTKDFVQPIFKKAFPVILNEAFWALGMIAYVAVYGRLGTGSMASVQISNTIDSLFMVIAFGLGNASTVMLGTALGAGKIEEAKEDNKRFLILGVILGLILGIGLALSGPTIVKSFFNLEPMYEGIAITLIYIKAGMITLRIVNTILIIGTLRSGGDTIHALILEISGVWLVGVPIAVISGLVFHADVTIVVLLVGLEEVTKFIFGMKRVRTGKWANNLVDQ